MVQREFGRHRVVGYLQAEELEAILAAQDRSTTQGRRDHALLLFLARTGARVSEAVAVNVGDLRLNTPSQVLLHGTADLLLALGNPWRQSGCCNTPVAIPFVHVEQDAFSSFVTYIHG